MILLGDANINLFVKYQLNFSISQQLKAEHKEFVLNKKCPKCGSKVYWINAKKEYICQTCQGKELEVNYLNYQSKARKEPVLASSLL